MGVKGLKEPVLEMRTRYQPLIAGVVVLIALGLRLVSLTRVGLWIDEAYSVAIAQLPVSDIVFATSNDSHPPAYYLLLRGWTQLMGNSEFAVRLLSVFAGVLAVALMYRLAREFLTPSASLPVIWIIAFSPALIEYSQETRMYALLCLWGIILVLFALRIDRLARASTSGRKILTYLAYIIVAATGLYIQYFFVFLIFALGLWIFVRELIRRDWQPLLYWIVAQVLILLLYLPWVPSMLYQMRVSLFTWLGRPTWTNLLNTLSYLSIGQAHPSMSGSLIIFSILVITWCFATYRLFGQRRQVDVILLSTWLLLPLIATFVVSQNRPVYTDRQFLFVIPALVLFSMGGVVSRRRWASLFAVGVSLVCLFSLNHLYFESQKQEWREVVQYIESHAGPNDAIYLNPMAGRLAVDYYLKAPMSIEGYPAGYDIRIGGLPGQQTTPAIIDDQFSALRAKHHDIWLVQFVATYWDPDKNIINWLEQHATRQEVPSFYGLDVRRYRLTP